VGDPRILVIDDNAAIHGDFFKILRRDPASGSPLDAAKAALFGRPASAASRSPECQVEAALSGQEGVRMAAEALRQGRPYDVAFVDMRMPNGWDGLETIRQLWAVDADLQVVLCTAYSDYSFEQIGQAIEQNDRFLILKKPFDVVEVRQLARTLTEKRRLKKQADQKMDDLEKLVRERTEEIQFLALHDRLTGLPNRALLLERLGSAIHRRARNDRYKFAVLFLDLDRFKLVNDSLGHAVGDELLLQAARRLQESVRRTDVVCSGTGTTSRLGGDEFVILLDDLREYSDAARVAARLVDVLAAPYQLAAHAVHATVSIGITTSERDYREAEAVIRDADTAMYRAKTAGRGRYAIFDETMHAEVTERLRLETELRRALSEGEFLLYYQPIMHTRKGLAGFEALCRWNHPSRGVLCCEEFLSVAEDMGLMQQLDLWALREGCRQLREWKRRYPSLADITLSVNLSRKDLRDGDIATHIRQILQDTDTPPQDLVLEITESAVLDDQAAALRVLCQIRDDGVRLHLDDFGIGQSSLSCFHQFPLNGLKIDRSLVQGLAGRPEMAVVLKAIRQMTQAFHMDVIAEGIESAQQADLLRDLDFEQIQGYLIAHPMPADQIDAFIAGCLNAKAPQLLTTAP
jgi:diguanylate cyclase (GGDEF)-like protein